VLRRASEAPDASAACDLVKESRHGLGARVMTLIVLTFLICTSDGTQCEPGYQAHRDCRAAQAYVRARLHPSLMIKDIVCTTEEKR
jgi:hypothetical protein